MENSANIVEICDSADMMNLSVMQMLVTPYRLCNTWWLEDATGDGVQAVLDDGRGTCAAETETSRCLITRQDTEAIAVTSHRRVSVKQADTFSYGTFTVRTIISQHDAEGWLCRWQGHSAFGRTTGLSLSIISVAMGRQRAG